MLSLNLRVACLSIAFIIYPVQAVPVSYGAGDVVYSTPVQQVGAGGQVPHPHIVMASIAPGHPAGHDLVFAPVTHSLHPDLGHSIPMPLNHPTNQHQHGVTGNVLQLETGNSASTFGQGRFRHSNVDDHARHLIAADKHIEASSAHNDAAMAHTNAANLHLQSGNLADAQYHTMQATHHTAQATAHYTEANNHILAAGGHAHNPFVLSLENVTGSKHSANNSADAARLSAQHVMASQHAMASTAHTAAAAAHGRAAVAHTGAARRFRNAGQNDVALWHITQARHHRQAQTHHADQAAAHLDPARNTELNPWQAKTDARISAHNATESQSGADRSLRRRPVHHPPPAPHYRGGRQNSGAPRHRGAPRFGGGHH